VPVQLERAPPRVHHRVTLGDGNLDILRRDLRLLIHGHRQDDGCEQSKRGRTHQASAGALLDFEIVSVAHREPLQ